MKVTKKVKYLTVVLLIVSMITGCGSTATSESMSEQETKSSTEIKDKELIEAEINNYLSKTVFDKFNKQDSLYEKYMMCSSINMLASLINILDEKIGKIKSDFGVNQEVAQWIMENCWSQVEELISDEEGTKNLSEIVTRGCKTKIVEITEGKGKSTYEVKVIVNNMDILQSLNSEKLMDIIIDGILKENIITTKEITGATQAAATVVVKGETKKRKIFMAALKSLLISCGKKVGEVIKSTMSGRMEGISVSNSYTGIIKVKISDGKVSITEEDQGIINACHGVFDKKFLSMEPAVFYEKKVDNLVAVRNEREELAEQEKALLQEEEEKKKEVEEKRKKEEEKAKVKALEKTTVEKKTDGKDETDTGNISDESITAIEELCVNFAKSNGEKYMEKEMTEKMKKYFDIPQNEKIFLSHDDTVFGSGKDGFVITEKGFYCNKCFENELYFVAYSDFTKIPTLSWDTGYLYADDKLISYVTISDDKERESFEKLYMDIFEALIK